MIRSASNPGCHSDSAPTLGLWIQTEQTVLRHTADMHNSNPRAWAPASHCPYPLPAARTHLAHRKNIQHLFFTMHVSHLEPHPPCLPLTHHTYHTHLCINEHQFLHCLRISQCKVQGYGTTQAASHKSHRPANVLLPEAVEVLPLLLRGDGQVWLLCEGSCIRKAPTNLSHNTQHAHISNDNALVSNV